MAHVVRTISTMIAHVLSWMNDVVSIIWMCMCVCKCVRVCMSVSELNELEKQS